MHPFTLLPVTAGWPLHEVRDTRGASRILLRNALLLSSALHLTVALTVSPALRGNPPSVAGVPIRIRTVILNPLPRPPALVQVRPVAAGPRPVVGTPIPVPHDLLDAAREWADAVTRAFGGTDRAVGAPEEAWPIQDSGGTEAAPAPAGEPFAVGATLEQAPVPTARVEPEYPEWAREAQVEGSVILHVLVGSDGDVGRVRVVGGVTALGDLAVQALRRWKFRPARVDGHAVAAWVEIVVRFRLER